MTGRPFSPTPVNCQLRDNRRPCPLGSVRARNAAPRTARGTHWARPFRSARVFACPKCVHGSECTRVWARCVSFRVGFLFRHFACVPAWGTPLLIPTPSFARRESLLRSRDVWEARVPTPWRPHHSPSATCVAAPAPARLQLQRGRLLAAESPAFQPAPGSGRPPGPAWWSGAGPPRPRPRPKEGSGLPGTPSTADPEPSPAVARGGPRLPSGFTTYWIWL